MSFNLFLAVFMTALIPTLGDVLLVTMVTKWLFMTVQNEHPPQPYKVLLHVTIFKPSNHVFVRILRWGFNFIVQATSTSSGWFSFLNHWSCGQSKCLDFSKKYLSFCFGDRITYGPGWPRTCCITILSFELLILPDPPPKCGVTGQHYHQPSKKSYIHTET